MLLAQDEKQVVALRVHRGRVLPVTHVRSTLLYASLLLLRERGLESRYMALLPSAYARPIAELVPGTWAPVDVAIAHYEAADLLGISAPESFEMGRALVSKIQGAALGTFVQVALGAGLSPWQGLPQVHRVWDRLLRGGPSAIYRVGPREARVEVHGVPLARIAYIRAGWRGLLTASAELQIGRPFPAMVEMADRDRSSAIMSTPTRRVARLDPLRARRRLLGGGAMGYASNAPIGFSASHGGAAPAEAGQARGTLNSTTDSVFAASAAGNSNPSLDTWITSQAQGKSNGGPFGIIH